MSALAEEAKALASEFSLSEDVARRHLLDLLNRGSIRAMANAALYKRADGHIVEYSRYELGKNNWSCGVYDWSSGLLLRDEAKEIALTSAGMRFVEARDISLQSKEARALRQRISDATKWPSKEEIRAAFLEDVTAIALEVTAEKPRMEAGASAPPSVERGKAKKQRGRRKRSGGKVEADRPLIEQMRDLRQADKDLSITGAAREVLVRHGLGNSAGFDSDVRRLQRRYSDLSEEDPLAWP